MVTYGVIGQQLLPNSMAVGQLPPLQFGGGLLELAILFLILAVIAGFLGVNGIAGFSWDIAKWLVIIFIVLAIISFIL